MISEILPGDYGGWLNPLTRGIGSLGDITFVASRHLVRTLNDFQRTSKARFAKHDLIGLTPQLEFLGPDLDDISFNIKLVKSLGVSPEEEFKKIRELVINGQDVPLVLGGEVIGRFVIESVTESAQIIDGRGNIIVCELSLALKQFEVYHDL